VLVGRDVVVTGSGLAGGGGWVGARFRLTYSTYIKNMSVMGKKTINM
jgi:hypothetical protein